MITFCHKFSPHQSNRSFFVEIGSYASIRNHSCWYSRAYFYSLFIKSHFNQDNDIWWRRKDPFRSLFKFSNAEEFQSEFHKINFFAFATKLKYISSFAHKVFPFTLLICINDIYLYFFLFLLFLPYISAKINNYFVRMWCDVSLCFF